MNRIDEMRYHESMRLAERTEMELQSVGGIPSRIRPTLSEQEMRDIVDGLTAHLAYGRLSESGFMRVRETRDRFADMLADISPTVRP